MNAQRQEFLTRCLNAAANFYGIVSYSEFIKLYNRYSADKEPPVSDLLQQEEIDEINLWGPRWQEEGRPQVKSQLEEYFRKFIVDVQGLTMSSANHYA